MFRSAPASGRIVGVTEAASRLEVSRTTIYGRSKTSKLISWKTAKRRLCIPAGQIIGPGRVVSDLKEVFDVIEDSELAWVFLAREWAFEEMVAQPLELLKNGHIGEVLGAAPGFGATFT
ncbi:MAG: hypothetical protein OXD29_10600 [Roseovarius sp.]|nr:hypothetical protein [Roseovarius sp.]